MKSLGAEQLDPAPLPELIAATEQAMPHQANALVRARAFAEPPMDFRIDATASACASVFSPVPSVSPAMNGSAKARARTSAFA